MPVPRTTGDLITAAYWNSIGSFQIASIDLSSTATFSSIPQVYRDLRIDVNARSTQAAPVVDMRLRVNGSSAAAYYWHRWRAIDATPSAGAATGETSAVVANVAGANAGAERFGSASIHILEYAATGVRIAGRSESSVLPSSSATTDYWRTSNSFGFNSSVAVTSVTLLLASGAFAAGSRATLYGVGAK